MLFVWGTVLTVTALCRLLILRARLPGVAARRVCPAAPAAGARNFAGVGRAPGIERRHVLELEAAVHVCIGGV